MKPLLILSATALLMLSACTTSRQTTTAKGNPGEGITAEIDLVHVPEDKVSVTVYPHFSSQGDMTLQFAKIIPGTYAIADYGRYIENVQAFDKTGHSLTVTNKDVNTWVITNGAQVDHITYQVNDTFDSEGDGMVFSENSKVIFSPAGTNILAGKNFVLNLCGFVCYFSGRMETPYRLKISHPENLYGTTAMTDTDPSATQDLFLVNRYADMVDNPIMYASPDVARFSVDGMDVELCVYSPRNKNVSAAILEPALHNMVVAQKRFLGKLNTTKKYAVLAYLSDLSSGDAHGAGALEHNSSTTAVFQDQMSEDDLVHVISHEFFHTVTPLKMHSKEIHYFDFTVPHMSQHLWFYEGFTEYFAQYFQVNQDLTTAEAFLDQMAAKENNSKMAYNDSLSFTYMSKHVLDPKMKAQYPNVYEKGAMMAMCIDILLRESSHGKKGLIDLMAQLSKKYGANKPFDDDAFIPAVSRMTNPAVARFLEDHVVKGIPIDYPSYMKKVGVERTTVPFPEPIVFFHANKPYVGIDGSQGKVLAVIKDDDNAFMKNLGVQDGDELISLNGNMFDAEDVMASTILGYGLKEGAPIRMEIVRDGKPMVLEGKISLNYIDGPGYRFKDETKRSLYNAWLKG